MTYSISDLGNSEHDASNSAKKVNVVAGSINTEGDIPHDSTDSGNPIKIGTKAIDMTPTDAEQGPTNVTENDRVNILADLKGRIINSVNSRYNILDNVSTTYNDIITETTSSAIECWQFKKVTLALDLTKANTPVDIQLIIEISLNGTNFFRLTNGPLSSYTYDDTVVGSLTLSEAYTFDIACQKIRLKVIATGTDATNTFTIANASIYLRD